MMKSSTETLTQNEREELLRELLNERFKDATRERFAIEDNVRDSK